MFANQMKNRNNNLWQGLDDRIQKSLTTRDYKAGSLSERLSRTGLEAGELARADRSGRELRAAWIPGVEIFPRTIHSQRHRGVFGEFARRDEGILAQIGLWPAQWATARMFAHSAKGFHVHPPNIPEKQKAAAWLKKLFLDEPRNYAARALRSRAMGCHIFCARHRGDDPA